MIIQPTVANDGRGGFKKAKGKGTILLKCRAELPKDSPPIKFRIGIGSGDLEQPRRGPISHNFLDSNMCRLPLEEATWDLPSAVDKKTNTFVVVLEVVPQ